MDALHGWESKNCCVIIFYMHIFLDTIQNCKRKKGIQMKKQVIRVLEFIETKLPVLRDRYDTTVADLSHSELYHDKENKRMVEFHSMVDSFDKSFTLLRKISERKPDMNSEQLLKIRHSYSLLLYAEALVKQKFVDIHKLSA